jgi:hypothetical protein
MADQLFTERQCTCTGVSKQNRSGNMLNAMACVHFDMIVTNNNNKEKIRKMQNCAPYQP